MCRRLPQDPSSNLQLRRQDPALARHTGSSFRPTILVLEIAYVLVASRLGAILCGMDLELPSRTARQHQHPGMDGRLRSCDCPGVRGTRRNLGASDEEACSNGEAREGAHGLQSRPEARTRRS